jgi:hypothetical protein
MKTTKQSFQARIAMTAVLIVAGFGIAPAVRAAQDTAPATTCSTASLAGAFGASLSGVEVTSTGNLNLAVVGRLVADGKGNIPSMAGTVSLGGVIVAATGSGTYTVSANCTGTATLNTSVIPTVHISFTLVSTASRALAIGTDATYVVTGELDKQ